MLYCTYDMLNMFQALLCPSSGALDYVCVIAACGVQCLVAGCRRSGAGSRVCVQEEGCCTTHDVSRAISLYLDAWPAALHLTPDNQQPSTAHHRL